MSRLSPAKSKASNRSNGTYGGYESDSSDDMSMFSDDLSYASSQLTSVSRIKSKYGSSQKGSPTRTNVSRFSRASVGTRGGRFCGKKLPHSSRNSGNPLNPFCSEFGHQFDEGNLPVQIDQGVVGASKRHIGWSVDILSLDFSHHLPLFMSGLVETDPPYNFLAYEGTLDMLTVGGPKHRVLTCIQKVVPALKLGLQSGHRESVSKALYVFLLLLKCDAQETGGFGAMGKALAPYLPRILPTLNIYCADDHKIGVDGAYQVAELSMSNLVMLVLETCEEL
eukprot:CAMPEP_0118641912 /NCGR_PEP_ID=MMETSP0785-20121206/5560_1 /TAXON_ID=91992 /ORGANISM="Bolidomonas pacifica, Strain CCMP 1866" /LENGTH=279 /DNA_ID=CAMNT_0006533439 /DNA_START=95 /DNA_END=930 /DNA_ORIENTATION=-